MDRRMLDDNNVASTLCNPRPYDGDCEACRRDRYMVYECDIEITCVLCGGKWTVSKEKANYARKFGTEAGLPICPDCKEALEFSKEMKRMCERKTVNNLRPSERFIGVMIGNCPNCNEILINKDKTEIRFCKYCGQAVKWDE